MDRAAQPRSVGNGYPRCRGSLLRPELAATLANADDGTEAEYLHRWNASPQWRQAIARLYEHEGIDLAEGRLEGEWCSKRQDREEIALGGDSGGART